MQSFSERNGFSEKPDSQFLDRRFCDLLMYDEGNGGNLLPATWQDGHDI